MKFKTFNSDTGYLIPFSLKKDIPFTVKRIFIINGKKNTLLDVCACVLVGGRDGSLLIATMRQGDLFPTSRSRSELMKKKPSRQN